MTNDIKSVSKRQAKTYEEIIFSNLKSDLFKLIDSRIIGIIPINKALIESNNFWWLSLTDSQKRKMLNVATRRHEAMNRRVLSNAK